LNRLTYISHLFIDEHEMQLQSRMAPGDDEYDIIDAAVAEVSNMAMYNNDSIREMEQRLEQNESMMKVVNLTRINVFDDPTRSLIMWTFNLKCSRLVSFKSAVIL
jgi:hypothetical protein